ncbi:MAG TPA: hypothetical protein VFA67_02540 [Candidatus Sulfotelmatobacter sp.]|nr:hypothetical protein [Candidatus Sulfotelmatobacter sp.]
MAPSGAATGRAAYDANSVAGLARFFPDAIPMRLPVQLTRILDGNTVDKFGESAIVEFGTNRELLFASKAPLEFGDQLRVRNSDGSLDETASVVAVQYQPGKILVAARFQRDVPNWIVKS